MSGQGSHSTVSRATQRGPENGGDNHPDTAREAIDGTLNTKQQTKTGSAFYWAIDGQRDSRTDFKLLQNEPRPGCVCRSDFFSFLFSAAENSAVRCESERCWAYCFAGGAVITRHTCCTSPLLRRCWDGEQVFVLQRRASLIEWQPPSLRRRLCHFDDCALLALKKPWKF